MHRFIDLRFSIRSVIPAICLFLILGVSTSAVLATTVFFNEIHYDNAGGDSNEGVEIAGPGGLDLSGWQLLLYNGSRGNAYGTHNLAGIIPDLSNGFGLLSFPISGIQNGPDGFALVNDLNEVIQFLSYEGSFTATEGAADGLSSMQISVAESTSTASLDSLQLAGSGRRYDDFQWFGPQAHSFGAINNGQIIKPLASVAPVPAPATLPLLLSGIAVIGLMGRRKKTEYTRTCN